MKNLPHLYILDKAFKRDPSKHICNMCYGNGPPKYKGLKKNGALIK
jgi:hypothetical protein